MTVSLLHVILGVAGYAPGATVIEADDRLVVLTARAAASDLLASLRS